MHCPHTVVSQLVACTCPAGKRGKKNCRERLPSHVVTPRGLRCLPVGWGRRSVRASTPAARPLRLGLHVCLRLRPLGSGQTEASVTFLFPSGGPPPGTGSRSPLSSASLTRTGPPETSNQTARKKENIFISQFFPHKTKEREVIFQGPPAPEPTTSPAASRRLRGAPIPAPAWAEGGGRRAAAAAAAAAEEEG